MRLVAALWHSSEPLSAHRFHSEYVDPARVTLKVVNYHTGVLERSGIARVLDGPNRDEAVRRLQLKP